VLPDVVRSAILARRNRGTRVRRAVLERCLGRAALRSGHGVAIVLVVVVELRAGPVLDDIVIVIVIARRFAQQPFAVCDRDAVIVRMDFAEGQETVAVAAILDERRLKRRFDAGYLREIDISFERASAGDLDVKFFQLPSVRHRDPSFLRVGGVDQHDLCHSG
jgi:hypothetical protein